MHSRRQRVWGVNWGYFWCRSTNVTQHQYAITTYSCCLTLANILECNFITGTSPFGFSFDMGFVLDGGLFGGIGDLVVRVGVALCGGVAGSDDLLFRRDFTPALG